ncbi:MAG TPA: alpha/beta hydrolase [Homoserinimonas sp.]|nr:alpha/beta hydrolase [Homoserinimonas sp.]
MGASRTEGFVEVDDGERIWFETAGTGPDLVLCHGLGGNATVWYQQVPYFARGNRVITWDQRGFGRSSNVNRKHGPLTAVSDLGALLDHLEVSSADIVGQSMGGWVALGAALAIPERIASLVLACTTAGIPVERESVREQPAPVAGGALPLGGHPAIDESLRLRDPARAYLYQALGTFGDRPADSELMRMLAETTFDDNQLRRLDIPVLMIAGERDRLMTTALLRQASSWLADARLVEMPGLGHSPYFEDPDSWNRLVADFLARER